jgi:hypothetical protein
MKSWIVFFLFVSTIGYSQSSDFNLSELKAFKTTIGNLSNQEQAIIIENTLEKILMSEFSFVDYSTKTGYFIIKNNNYIAAIEANINSLNNYTCSNSQEITLDENLFLEMYSKRGGMKNGDLKNQPPNYYFVNGNDKKTELLYQVAKEIWVKKYPESYNALYNSDNKGKEYVPEHYPVFVNTGNPENDNFIFDKAKQEWIKNYPDEVEQATGRSYRNATGIDHPRDVEKMKTSNKLDK